MSQKPDGKIRKTGQKTRCLLGHKRFINHANTFCIRCGKGFGTLEGRVEKVSKYEFLEDGKPIYVNF